MNQGTKAEEKKKKFTGDLAVGLKHGLLQRLFLKLDLLLELPAEILQETPFLVTLVGSKGQCTAADLHDDLGPQSGKHQLFQMGPQKNKSKNKNKQTINNAFSFRQKKGDFS